MERLALIRESLAKKEWRPAKRVLVARETREAFEQAKRWKA